MDNSKKILEKFLGTVQRERVEIIEAKVCPNHIHMLGEYSTTHGISQGEEQFNDIRIGMQI